MSGPLIFISRSRVRDGKWDEYEQHCKHATALVDGEEPRVIAFHHFANDDHSEVSTVQVHPDTDSLDQHLKVFAEKLMERAFDSLDTYELDIYGVPSEQALTMLTQVPGAQVRVLEQHTSGFLRPQPL